MTATVLPVLRSKNNKKDFREFKPEDESLENLILILVLVI